MSNRFHSPKSTIWSKNKKWAKFVWFAKQNSTWIQSPATFWTNFCGVTSDFRRELRGWTKSKEMQNWPKNGLMKIVWREISNWPRTKTGWNLCSLKLTNKWPEYRNQRKKANKSTSAYVLDGKKKPPPMKESKSSKEKLNKCKWF